VDGFLLQQQRQLPPIMLTTQLNQEGCWRAAPVLLLPVTPAKGLTALPNCLLKTRLQQQVPNCTV
jgi:hypothetical protein